MNDSPVVPWGISRMAPFPPPDGIAPNYRVVLDPVTQAGNWVDPMGQVIEAGKHGTNVNKSTATQPAGPDGGDGKPPPPAKPDSVTDHVPD
ncbi:putative ATP-grasp target RiPP [Sinosporangium album]|uniref:Putative ATP-grasp target RiPP n=1 Tax=Sinosporangium album TaxID=504805 RepID=A0A1G8IFM2_9ACTN|nr:putative ATP-grasp target RiPP [Sinosporangium album]